jgi:hypothetical protein
MTDFAPIKPSNIVVLFPPGSGGNFLIKMLTEKSIFKLLANHASMRINYEIGLLDANEFSYDYFPIIAPRHLNQFFTRAGGIAAGAEVYSLKRYREILAAYRYSKFIIVHTTPQQRSYCEALNVIKAMSNSPEKFSRPGHGMDKKASELKQHISSNYTKYSSYHARRPHHYREFSKNLKRQGTYVLDVEYYDLFIEPNVVVYDQLAGFVIGGMGFRPIETAQDYAKSAEKYHRSNQKLIRDYIAAENLKSMVTYTAVKNPGAIQ